MEDEERTVQIPVGYVGASEPDDNSGMVDELGNKFAGNICGDGMYEIKIPAFGSYLIKMRAK